MESFKKITVKIAIIYVICLVGFAIFSLFTVQVQPNEYAVIRQFGKVIDIRDNADGSHGLSFRVPILNQVEKLPNCLLIYDLPASSVITSDKKTMDADCFALYQITNPMANIRALSGSISATQARIDVNVYNGLKNTISSTSQTDVITGRSGALAQSIMDNIGNDLESYGIYLASVETKKLDLPDANKEPVYTRMITEREQIAQAYTAEGNKQAQMIRNETDKQTAIIRSNAELKSEQLLAEAEQKYMKILSDAYSSPEKADFYSFVRALDAAKIAFTQGDIIYLDENSPLASIFMKTP